MRERERESERLNYILSKCNYISPYVHSVPKFGGEGESKRKEEEEDENKRVRRETN